MYAFCTNDPVNKWDYLGTVSLPTLSDECENGCAGKYILTRNVRVNHDELRRGLSPNQFIGFELEYVRNEKSKYEVTDIRLVQAIKYGSDKPKIDTQEGFRDQNKATKDGIPLPGYRDVYIGKNGIPRSGTYNQNNPSSLAYTDAPYRQEIPLFGTIKDNNYGYWHIETCAITSSDNKNLGCISFKIHNWEKTIPDLTFTDNKYTTTAKKPTSLWTAAATTWVKEAGSKYKGK